MKTPFLIFLLCIPYISNAQKERITFYPGIVDKDGYSFKLGYDYKINNFLSLGTKLGYFDKNPEKYYLSTFYNKGVYSYNFNSNIKAKSYYSVNLFNIGINSGVDIMKAFKKVKRHRLSIGTGLYWKNYSISNNSLILDNSNTIVLRSTMQKSQSELSLNYFLQYYFQINKNFSVGSDFEVIPYDGGNANIISLSLSRHF
jgi:hypothetical protein